MSRGLPRCELGAPPLASPGARASTAPPRRGGHRGTRGDPHVALAAGRCALPRSRARARCDPAPVQLGAVGAGCVDAAEASPRSEEHTSELQSLMRISYAVFCLKKKKKQAV